MPPQKQRADKQKAKEKKEKMILIGLVAVLVVVGAIEVPSMLKSKSPGGATSSVAQTTSSSSAVSTNAAGTSASGTAAPGSLPNSSGYKAGAGQLSGFSLFKGNVDPFGTATISRATTSETTTTSGNTKTTKITKTTTQHGSYVAARISTNGTSEDVAPNETFPAASPVFVLDSVSAKKIEISIAGGSFSNGRAKLTIAKGKSVTLVNTVDSTRYTIRFIIPLTASMITTTTGTTTTGTATTGTATTGTTTTGAATTGTTTTG